MKYYLFLIAVLIAYPAFSACPVDGITDACIAEFQTVPIAKPMRPSISQQSTVREFLPVPHAATTDKSEPDNKPLRTFGPTNQDYGYNSSCQFGICRNTGTPKNFGGQDN